MDIKVDKDEYLRRYGFAFLNDFLNEFVFENGRVPFSLTIFDNEKRIHNVKFNYSDKFLAEDIYENISQEELSAPN